VPAATCDLCGLPILGRPVTTGAAGDRRFCCEGCSRVWSVASQHGIGALTEGPVTGSRRDAGKRKAAAAALAGARRATLRVDGMWCSSCALVLQEALLDLEGVLDAEVSYAASLARVTYDPSSIGTDAVIDRITTLGYRAEPGGLSAGRDARDAHSGELFLRFFVSMVVGMWVMWPSLFLLYPAFLRGEYAGLRPVELFTGALSLVVLLFGGWPFLRGAWRAARVGRATMDTLVVLGTWTAWSYSLFAASAGSDGTYFESAAMITTIVLLGRWLESLGRADAADALAGLGTGRADEAWLVPAGGRMGDAERVAVDRLAEGSLVAVRAGERFPADGVVRVGHTSVDQARLTGEPLAVERGSGDEVWAGTVNVGGPVLVEVSRVGSATLAGRILALVEDASFAKSHMERLADAVAGVFVPVVLAVAAMTLLLTWAAGPGIAEGVRRAVAVLVVACPCALGLATPLAVANATARAGRAGVLVRGGEVLERAGHIATVAFDKTGTLTQGRPAVAGVLPGSMAPDDAAHMLAAAAAVEQGGAHPAAEAIRLAAKGTGLRLTAGEVTFHPGLGVEGTVERRRVLVGSARMLALEGISLGADVDEAREAESLGRSVVWVADGGRLLGGLVLADPVRQEAAAVVGALHSRGTATALVSGDAETTCRAVGEQLGVDIISGEVLPHDKEHVVRELQAVGPVAFVGDGVNDAPALAASDLAVAMGDASEVALLAADVVLLGGETGPGLSALPVALATAVRTRRVIRENLAWAFSYNAVAVPLAVTGLLSPVAAAAAMALSSLAVVANSLRLRLR